MWTSISQNNQRAEGIVCLIFLFVYYCLMGFIYSLCIKCSCRIFGQYILLTIFILTTLIFYIACEFTNNPLMFETWMFCHTSRTNIFLLCWS